KGNVVGQGGDDVFRIDDLHRLVGDDVLGADHAALVAVDANGARLLAGVLHHQALDVEDDVGDVLDPAGDGGDFVLHALDLDLGNGAALKAGQQDTAQAVADRHAEAALERFGAEFAVGVGKRVAFADHAVGQLQATPSNTHETQPPESEERSGAGKEK